MALFNKRTNLQKLEIELDRLNARATILAGKRAVCAVAMDEAKSGGQRLLLLGDLEDETAGASLRERVSNSQNELVDLDSALVSLAGSITEAEHAVEAEQRRIKCEADAASLAVVVANVEKHSKPFLEAARALASDLESLNGFRYQAAGLAAYFRRVAGEGEIALRVVIDDFSGAVGAVANGTQKITIGSAAPSPAIAETVAQPANDHFIYTDQPHSPTYRVPGGFNKETS